MSSGSDPRFRLDAPTAEALAKEFGTPLYVIDEATLRSNLRAYRDQLGQNGDCSYACKANSTVAVLQIAHSEGFTIDVASEGELRAALLGGIPASACHFHGNNKLARELEFALGVGVGEIIVDNMVELHWLSSVDLGQTKLLLRLAPEVRPQTNEKISTGQRDTKFGFGISDGQAESAVEFCLKSNLPLIGFHCHVGSQLIDPEAQLDGARTISEFARAMWDRHSFKADVINVGGGRAASYLGTEDLPNLREYLIQISGTVAEGLGDSEWKPKLRHEPGRSVIAEAGVTLYQVGIVKEVSLGLSQHEGVPSVRNYAMVDGGLSDNPRPALYGSKYEVLGFKEGRKTVFRVSGRHCETDTLFEDVELSEDLNPGDLIQVLTTGAYNSSMASNYNRFPRPATVLLRKDGAVFLAQNRETFEQMLGRERAL